MNKEFVELMLRAPAVPEWYDPSPHRGAPLGNGEYHFRNLEQLEADNLHQQKRLMEWPSYYARKVMEAAGEQPRPSYNPTKELEAALASGKLP